MALVWLNPIITKRRGRAVPRLARRRTLIHADLESVSNKDCLLTRRTNAVKSPPIRRAKKVTRTWSKGPTINFSKTAPNPNIHAVTPVYSKP
jgi:hypothetical protein